jgi:hypothetical protein
VPIVTGTSTVHLKLISLNYNVYINVLSNPLEIHIFINEGGEEKIEKETQRFGREGNKGRGAGLEER